MAFVWTGISIYNCKVGRANYAYVEYLAKYAFKYKNDSSVVKTAFGFIAKQTKSDRNL